MFKCIEKIFYFERGWKVTFRKNECEITCASLVVNTLTFPCDKAERYQNETLAIEILQEKFKEICFNAGKHDCVNGFSFETLFNSSDEEYKSYLAGYNSEE